MSIDMPGREIRFDQLPVTEGIEAADTEAVEEQNRVSLAVRAAQAGAAAIILAEVTPANEVLRGLAVAATEVATTNASATTAAFAGATIAVEATAAVVTAKLLGSPGVDRITGWISEKAKKFGIGGDDGYKTGVVADLVLGGVGGSAVAVFAKHIQEPKRTFSQDARFGTANALAVTTIASPIVWGVTKIAETVGWENFGVGAGIAAVTGTAILGAKKKIESVAGIVSDAPTSVTQVNEAIVEPDYHMDAETMARTEAGLVDVVRQRVGSKACAVWLRGDSVAANVIRTLEAERFDGIQELMAANENTSRFLAVVDTRQSAGQGRIVRATRLTSALFAKDSHLADPVASIAMAQGLIESGQISANEINAYYDQNRFDLSNTYSVETNFKIGESAKRVRGIPMSQLAYGAMVRFAVRTTKAGALPSIMAHVNDATISSFARLGIEHEAFAGRDDLRTPDENGGYDEKYIPAVYIYEGKTRSAFRKLGLICKLPEIEL